VTHPTTAKFKEVAEVYRTKNKYQSNGENKNRRKFWPYQKYFTATYCKAIQPRKFFHQSLCFVKIQE
jgi:hypothetical protein